MRDFLRLPFGLRKGSFFSDFLKNEKVILFITTLQESFSAIVPYFLMLSFVSFISSLLQYFNVKFISQDTLNALAFTFSMFSSIVAVTAISYFFALRLKISPIIAPILSIAAFISISLLFESPSTAIVLPYGFNIQALFVPIASVYLLKYFYPLFNLRIPLNYGHKHVYRLFNYLFVFVAAYFAVLLLYAPLDFIGDFLITQLSGVFAGLPAFIKLIARQVSVQFFWFFGIHGEHVVNALFTKDLLFKELFPNLTVAEFIRMFVSIGGAGVGLAMFFSLLLCVRDRTIRLIAKISAPFVIFNINTLLIYAVVVLNRYMIVPFMLLPILNAIAAYIFLSLHPVVFTTNYIVWTTPVFMDSYIKTGGNISIMLMQLFLLAFDTLVYVYFMKKFSASKDLMSAFQILEKNLEITTEIKASEALQPFMARSEIIEASAKLEKTLDSLTKNSLFVYY